MGANVGSIDKGLRLIAGTVVLAGALFFFEGVAQTVAVAAGAVCVLTALFGFCLVYRLFGISTCNR